MTTITAAEYRTTLSEHQIQAAFFAMVEIMENIDTRWSMIFAVPNGGHRNKATAAKMKREGVRRGVPDIFIAVPSNGYHGAFLETKKRGNTTTAEQKAFLKKAKTQGYFTAVCYSSDELEEKTREYFGERE